MLAWDVGGSWTLAEAQRLAVKALAAAAGLAVAAQGVHCLAATEAQRLAAASLEETAGLVAWPRGVRRLAGTEAQRLAAVAVAGAVWQAAAEAGPCYQLPQRTCIDWRRRSRSA